MMAYSEDSWVDPMQQPRPKSVNWQKLNYFKCDCQ